MYHNQKKKIMPTTLTKKATVKAAVKPVTKKATKKTEPVRVSTRKRPSKSFIQELAEYRGFMTSNQKLALKGLGVKNALQRINTRALNESFSTADCKAITAIMAKFVNDVSMLLK